MTRPGHPSASREEFETLRRTFQALGYDLGAQAAQVTRNMREKGVAPPQGWMSLDHKPHSKVFLVGDSRIGVLVFPPRPKNPGDFSRITERARTMEDNVSLLIGMSPWGANQEQKFLRQSPEAVDILLGGGSGPSFKEKYPGSGETLWIRPYIEGKAVYSVSIASLGTQGIGSADPNNALDIQLLMLKDDIPRKPNIKEIIR
jgi:hypothetical protein